MFSCIYNPLCQLDVRTRPTTQNRK